MTSSWEKFEELIKAEMAKGSTRKLLICNIQSANMFSLSMNLGGHF